VPVGHHVIDTLGAARLAEDFAAAEPSGEHPLVESMPGVAERRVEGLPLAGGEPVERDRKVLDADARHGGSFGWWWSVRPVDLSRGEISSAGGFRRPRGGEGASASSADRARQRRTRWLHLAARRLGGAAAASTPSFHRLFYLGQFSLGAGSGRWRR